jgi:glycosyltransferase involved in cell wall biosynthesis
MPMHHGSAVPPGNKIIILIGAFVRGGTERQAYLLARELRQSRGLDVEVWALKFGGEYAQDFEAVGVPTRVLGFQAPGYEAVGVQARRIPIRELILRDPRFPLRWARRLGRVTQQLKQGRADILLPLTTWPNVIAGLTYRFAGVRTCVWGERSAGLERVDGLERIAVRQYRRFAANSTAGMDFLAGDMRVSRARITLIPNGVEQPRIDPSMDWRAKLELQPGQPLVVKVANLSSFKDHATLLRAWKIVQETWQGDDLPVLALAGGFLDRYEECRRIVEEAGIESSVRFLGSVPGVATLIHTCDLTVFSSPKEGMPNGVLECMAGGRAIIASDLPGVRDALGRNAAEALVPPGDENAFARRLLDLLRDKDKREALGKANKARVCEEFSVERMADRYLDIIGGNLNKHAAAGGPQLAAAARL